MEREIDNEVPLERLQPRHARRRLSIQLVTISDDIHQHYERSKMSFVRTVLNNTQHILIFLLTKSIRIIFGFMDNFE